MESALGAEHIGRLTTGRRHHIAWAWCLCLLAQLTALAVYAAGHNHEFNVPAGRFIETMPVLMGQAGLEAFTADADVGDVRTRAVVGSMNAFEALDTLVQGTGLTYQFFARNTVRFRRVRPNVRWFDIPAGPARSGLQRFADLTDLDVALETPSSIDSAYTATISGCMSPQAAAKALLAPSGLPHVWLETSSGRIETLRIGNSIPPGSDRAKRSWLRSNDEWMLPAREDKYCRRLCGDEGGRGEIVWSWQTCLSFQPLAR